MSLRVMFEARMTGYEKRPFIWLRKATQEGPSRHILQNLTKRGLYVLRSYYTIHWQVQYKENSLRL